MVLKLFLFVTHYTAPTNEAFEKLPGENLDKDALINILTYHVVEGNFPSSSLSTGNLKTLNGEYVSVVVSGADVTVNDAQGTPT